MSFTREQVIDAARSMLGTPFHHQGRAPGVGVDCIGLFVCISRVLGVDPHDYVQYGREPDPDMLLTHIRKGMVEIPIPSAQRGDGLLLWWEKKRPQHFVLKSGSETIIHSLERKRRRGKVEEIRMPSEWWRQIHSAWRFKDLVEV